MKNFYKLLLAVILLPSLSLAQSNYKPGYLVTLKGDTLRGFIDYREWDNNPKDFAFKRQISQANADVFTGKAVSAFAVSGQQYYETYVVPVSQDSVEIASLQTKLNTNYKIDTVFLQVLNKGRYITLYKYKDKIKQRFYLLEKGQNAPYELIYHVYYNKDESGAIQYVRRFRTQFQNVIQKNGITNGGISREISLSDYSENDMTKIAEIINGNSSRQFTTPQLFGLRWFVGAGINYNNFKFTGNVDFADSRASNSISPKIDAGLDFFINKNIQRLFFRAEVAFTYNENNFSALTKGNVSGTSTLNFKQYNTSITPQLIYNFYNMEQLKAFIDLGVSINLALYNHYASITTYDSFSTVVQYNYPQFEKDYITIPVKAGIVIKKRFEIYACYIPSTSINGFSATAFSSNTTSYQFGLNYLLER
jgi:hypothetical protein